eukprot:scaffold81613_cov64-Phaeocystis_antarctica.AAC.3
MTTAGRASLGAARTAMPVGAKDMQSTMKDSIWQRATVGDSEVSNHNSELVLGWKPRTWTYRCKATRPPASNTPSQDVAWRGC